MATMMRFALPCLALLATSVGLSEQEGGFLAFLTPGEKLSHEGQLIKEAGNILKNRDSTSLETELSLITKIAARYGDNKLADRLKNLNVEVCDHRARAGVRDALERIQRSVSTAPQIRGQARRLCDVLQDYNRRTDTVCEREKEKRELMELDKLLDELGPNPELASQLELIASKGSENTLAAMLRWIIPGSYDIASQEAANTFIIEVGRRLDRAPDEAKRLLRILLSYKRQKSKVVQDWTGDYDALMEKLDEQNRTDIGRLSDIVSNFSRSSNIFGFWFPGKLPDDHVLKAAKKGIPGEINIFLLRMIKNDITRRVDQGQDLKGHPSWTYHETDVIHRLELELYNPCETFVGLESAGALKVLFEVSDLVNIEILMDAIGMNGTKRFDMIQWVGHWGICKWFLSLNKKKIAHTIVKNDKINSKINDGSN